MFLKGHDIGPLKITPPPLIVLRRRVVSFALGAYKVFTQSFAVKTSKRD